MKQIEPYLSHIVEAIKTIKAYAKGMNFDQFAKDIPLLGKLLHG